MTTNNHIVIEGSMVPLVRLTAMLRGAEFEARQRAQGSKMLVTRVGGGALATARREFGLPRSTKPDAVCAVIRAAIAAERARLGLAEEAEGR